MAPDKKITVFALDDDPGDIELLSRYLEDIPGWQIDFVSAESWSEGELFLAENDVDVIFLDYILGSETGMMVVQALRESGDERPVIILTGQGDERIAAEITRAGANDYLVKGELSADVLRRAICSVQAQFQLKKERVLLAEELQQVQKMETIGSLAGGIAHDFNNMLTAIVGHVELARLKDVDNLCEENLAKIQLVCKQMTELVRRLLGFSRSRSNEKSLVDFYEILDDVKAVLCHTLPKNIVITVQTTDRPLYIYTIGSMLHQVLLNLCINGAESMPAGGSLLIRAQKKSLSAEEASQIPSLKVGEFLVVEVEDSGSGIPPEVQEKIFDPFFSTKERDARKGTGLGMAVTWQNLQELGGSINFESDPGKGTVFRVYLPLLEPAPAGDDSRKEIHHEKVGADRHMVLVVDDEPVVRELGMEMLEQLGFATVGASDGLEAVDLLKQYRDEVALVILDISMPVMDGRQCIKELLKINPELKVVFASGHDMAGEEKSLMKIGARGVIQKPFLMRELGSYVQKVLDKE